MHPINPHARGGSGRVQPWVKTEAAVLEDVHVVPRWMRWVEQIVGFLGNEDGGQCEYQ